MIIILQFYHFKTTKVYYFFIKKMQIIYIFDKKGNK